MLDDLSNVSVVLSKEAQIKLRRAAIFELAAQGLSQSEIAERLGTFHISQQTVSRDLSYLRQESNEYIKRSREDLAHEFRLVLSNYKQLRKLAWKDFNEAKDAGIKAHLYHIILDINNDIMNMHAISDVIKAEVLLQESKDKIERTRQELDEIIGNDNGKSQAIF